MRDFRTKDERNRSLHHQLNKCVCVCAVARQANPDKAVKGE